MHSCLGISVVDWSHLYLAVTTITANVKFHDLLFFLSFFLPFSLFCVVGLYHLLVNSHGLTQVGQEKCISTKGTVQKKISLEDQRGNIYKITARQNGSETHSVQLNLNQKGNFMFYACSAMLVSMTVVSQGLSY